MAGLESLGGRNSYDVQKAEKMINENPDLKNWEYEKAPNSVDPNRTDRLEQQKNKKDKTWTNDYSEYATRMEKVQASIARLERLDPPPSEAELLAAFNGMGFSGFVWEKWSDSQKVEQWSSGDAMWA